MSTDIAAASFSRRRAQAYWIDRAFPPGFNIGTRGAARDNALDPFRQAVERARTAAYACAELIAPCDCQDDRLVEEVYSLFRGLKKPEEVTSAQELLRLEQDFLYTERLLGRRYRSRLQAAILDNDHILASLQTR